MHSTHKNTPPGPSQATTPWPAHTTPRSRRHAMEAATTPSQLRRASARWPSPRAAQLKRSARAHASRCARRGAMATTESHRSCGGWRGASRVEARATCPRAQHVFASALGAGSRRRPLAPTPPDAPVPSLPCAPDRNSRCRHRFAITRATWRAAEGEPMASSTLGNMAGSPSVAAPEGLRARCCASWPAIQQSLLSRAATASHLV